MFRQCVKNIGSRRCFGNVSKTLVPDDVSAMFPKHWFPIMFWQCFQNIGSRQCFGNVFRQCVKNIGSRRCFDNVSKTLVPDNVSPMFFDNVSKTLVPDDVLTMSQKHLFPTMFRQCLQNIGSQRCFGNVSKTFVLDDVSVKFQKHWFPTMFRQCVKSMIFFNVWIEIYEIHTYIHIHIYIYTLLTQSCTVLQSRPCGWKRESTPEGGNYGQFFNLIFCMFFTPPDHDRSIT